MDCCNVNGLDRGFIKFIAKLEVRSYRKKGLNKQARKLADFLKVQDIAGTAVLDIGCGIGALHLELLKAGATKAIGVDVSRRYIEAAGTLAQTVGLEDSVAYHVGDFVQLERELPQVDIALLDRVLCCYPYMKELVSASARHTERLYALTYPRWTWWMHAETYVENLFNALLRLGSRSFMHPPWEVRATLASAGFKPIFEDRSGVWLVEVYQRQ